MSERISPGRARALAAAAQAGNDPRTYAANVGEHYAAWLTGLAEPQGITHLGNGTVRFTAAAFAYLRSLPAHLDGSIDAEGQIYLGGESWFAVTRER